MASRAKAQARGEVNRSTTGNPRWNNPAHRPRWPSFLALPRALPAAHNALAWLSSPDLADSTRREFFLWRKSLIFRKRARQKGPKASVVKTKPILKDAFL